MAIKLVMMNGNLCLYIVFHHSVQLSVRVCAVNFMNILKPNSIQCDGFRFFFSLVCGSASIIGAKETKQLLCIGRLK